MPERPLRPGPHPPAHRRGKTFRRAMEIEPNRVESHGYFAEYYLLPLGQIDAAIRELRIATIVGQAAFCEYNLNCPTEEPASTGAQTQARWCPTQRGSPYFPAGRDSGGTRPLAR